MKLEDFILSTSAQVYVRDAEISQIDYLDGAERYLKEALLSAYDLGLLSADLKSKIKDWPSLYHLSPYRATIMDCFDFINKEAKVLELGAGCGAVTRWLGEHFQDVYAVEGSLQRASIVRLRCQGLSGVKVYSANFFDLDIHNQFDIVTLIGVLEYSHLYHPVHRGKPYEASLAALKSAYDAIKGQGILLLAIENKLGLKYFSGAKEDHSGKIFDGIQGYPAMNSPVTFSAEELENLLNSAGFTSMDYFLPFPDYKLAKTIINAQALSAHHHYLYNWIDTPFPDRVTKERKLLFNESLAIREITKAGLLKDLSNSFLIIAHKGDKDANYKTLGFSNDIWIAKHYSLDRHPAFCKKVTLVKTSSETFEVTNSLTFQNQSPVSTQGDTFTHSLITEKASEGDLLLFSIFEMFASDAFEKLFLGFLGTLQEFLLSQFSSGKYDQTGMPLLKGESLDVALWNIIVEDKTNNWIMIDREWTFKGLIPIDFIICRNVYYLFLYYKVYLRDTQSSSKPADELCFTIMQKFYTHYYRNRFELFMAFEQSFQYFSKKGTLSGEIQDFLGKFMHKLDRSASELPSDKSSFRAKVSIIIPVFNKIEYTRKCIESVMQNSPRQLYELIIVDNASTDRTHDFLENLKNEITVISNDRNIGYTLACNQGAEAATGQYLVFLNNDTEPQPGWLTELLDLAESDLSIGAVGAKLIYPNGKIQEAGGLIFSDGSGWNFGNGDDPGKENYNKICEVDYCSGACLLVRHDLFRQLGGFDKRFAPAYYEETDLCFGLRKIGYKVIYNPKAVVVHHESITAGRDTRTGIKKYIEINRQKFAEKWKEELNKQDDPPSRTGRLPQTADRRRLKNEPSSLPRSKRTPHPATVLISGHFSMDDIKYIEDPEDLRIIRYKKLDAIEDIETFLQDAMRSDLVVFGLFGSDLDSFFIKNIHHPAMKDFLNSRHLKKVLWTYDSHHSYAKESKYQGFFNRYYIAHSPYISKFQEVECHWLPCCYSQFGIDQLRELSGQSFPLQRELIFPFNLYTIGDRNLVADGIQRILTKRGVKHAFGKFEYGLPYTKALQESRICLNISLIDDLNIRNFEAWGLNRILLANNVPDFSRISMDLSHTFFFKRDLSDFEEALDAALSHDAKDIKTSEIVLNNHMLIHRYIEIINKELGTGYKVLNVGETKGKQLPEQPHTIKTTPEVSSKEHQSETKAITPVGIAAPSKKALVFFPHNLYPPRTGAHQRCISMIIALKELGYDVTLFSSDLFTEAPWKPESINGLQSDLGIKVQIYRGTQADWRFISEKSHNAWDMYIPPDMNNFFSNFTSNLVPELIMINYAYWGKLVCGDSFKSSLKIIDSHDLVTSNTKMRHLLMQHLGVPPFDPVTASPEVVDEKLFSQLNLGAFSDEYAIYDLFDYTIAISPNEADIIKNYTHSTKVEYIPMTANVRQIDNLYSGPPLFVIGPNPFNIQGYLYFARKVLPLILREVPEFILKIIGSSSSQLVSSPGIQLLGFIPDLQPLYADSKFAICPLIGGTGQQVKIVEAMGYGLPMVALRNVAGNSPMHHGINGFIANNAKEFADYTIQLFRDQELCRKMGQKARETIVMHFSQGILLNKLESIITEGKANIDNRKIHAEGNFATQTGGMGVKNILWIRTDAIGDNVLASSMLPYIKEKYKDATTTVCCQEHIAELYEACPHVDKILVFQKMRIYEDEAYRNTIVNKIRGLNADLALNSVYSREPLTDFLTLASNAKERIAFYGNLCNITEELRDHHNKYYTRLISSGPEHKPELQRYRDFLQEIGIDVPVLKTAIFLTNDDEKFADAFFQSHDLNPNKTIALFASAQFAVRLYEHYGRALSEICKDNSFTVVAFGETGEYGFNQINLDHLGVRTINLSGKTTLRQAAAIIKSCKLAVGSETGLAHIACAVETPNVILLGGGHFGRFMPYSSLTSVVCLPLECYNCDWYCKYQRVHCVRDVSQEVFSLAIQHTLYTLSDKPRIFIQDHPLWTPNDLEPKWKRPEKYLNVTDVDIIPISDVSDIPVLRPGNSQSMHPRVETPAMNTSAIVSGNKPLLNKPPKKILLPRFDTIGDLILLEGFLEALINKYPEAEIVLAVHEPYSQLKSLFPERIKWLTTRVNPYKDPDKDELRSFLNTLAEEPWDLILTTTFNRSYIDDAIALKLNHVRNMAFGEERFISGWYKSIFQDLGIHNTELNYEFIHVEEFSHETEKYRTLWKALTGENMLPVPGLKVPDDLSKYASDLLLNLDLKENDFCICNPAGTANVSIKAWPEERFADMISWLEKSYNLKTLLIGHEKEAETIYKVVHVAKDKGANPFIWLGKDRELPLLAAITHKARLYLGNDTGSMHIAAALGIPVVGIFGGGTFPRFLPVGSSSIGVVGDLKCFQCYWDCIFEDAPCLKLVSVEDAQKAVNIVLENNVLDSNILLSSHTIDSETFQYIEKAARMFKSLKSDLTGKLSICEADREARLRVINKQHNKLHDVEEALKRSCQEIYNSGGDLDHLANIFLTQRIQFGTDDASHFLLDGWSFNENLPDEGFTANWAIGKSASLFLSLPEDKSVQLTANMKAPKYQIVTIRADGREIGQWQLTHPWQWEHRSITVNPEDNRKNVSIIEFLFSENLTQEGDQRPLAALFESLTLREVSDLKHSNFPEKQHDKYI